MANRLTKGEALLGRVVSDDDLVAGDDLFVADAATIGGDVAIGGDTALSGDLTVDGDLTAEGDATVEGNLTVDGSVAFGDIQPTIAKPGATAADDKDTEARAAIDDIIDALIAVGIIEDVAPPPE
jgi:predicted acyltransferase (DUF342 family)